MKRLLTIGIAMLLVLSGSVPSNAEEPKMTAESINIKATNVSTTSPANFVESLESQEARQTLMVKEIAKNKKLNSNAVKIKKMVKVLRNQVGKTWYVFSGSTPRGWDCSGMTLWAYGKIGINLEHSASKQRHAGKVTKKPKVGDLVIFSYTRSKNIYHVAIYLGKDKMIHAGGNPGQVTSVASIKSWGGTYSTITYVRVLESKSFKEQKAQREREQQKSELFASSR
jgi:cell wall-associated NlpC family hydrolase